MRLIPTPTTGAIMSNNARGRYLPGNTQHNTWGLDDKALDELFLEKLRKSEQKPDDADTYPDPYNGGDHE